MLAVGNTKGRNEAVGSARRDQTRDCVVKMRNRKLTLVDEDRSVLIIYEEKGRHQERWVLTA